MNELFRRGRPASTPSVPIGALLRKKPTAGDIGIEIEVEGNKFPKPPGASGTPKATPMPDWKFWSYVKDGSLRGADNAEYVLTKPIFFKDVTKALDEIEKKLADYGSVIVDSNRASVHVHLNCQTFHLNRLASFAALWFCFEEVLTEWCGDHRVGNLFCLRGKDAPAIITRVKKFISSDGNHELSESLHYSGFNVQALNKFGSVEIRTLRGPTDFQVVRDWVNILERLYVLSQSFDDPREIPAMFSQQGPLSFFETVLGDTVPVVRAGISFDDNRIKESMYEGIRLAQDICYCRDWSVFKAYDIQPDPFNRDIKKVAAALSAATGAASPSFSLGELLAATSGPQPASSDAWSQVYSVNAPMPSFIEPASEAQDWFEPEYDEDD